MTITKQIRFNIECDACGTSYAWYLFDNITDAIRQIRDDGWGVKRARGGAPVLVACPDHNDFDNGE